MRTDAQKRADAKYRNQQEQVNLTFPKGTKERWKARAESLGMSLTAYITDLVESDIKKAEKQ